MQYFILFSISSLLHSISPTHYETKKTLIFIVHRILFLFHRLHATSKNAYVLKLFLLFLEGAGREIE